MLPMRGGSLYKIFAERVRRAAGVGIRAWAIARCFRARARPALQQSLAFP